MIILWNKFKKIINWKTEDQIQPEIEESMAEIIEDGDQWIQKTQILIKNIQSGKTFYAIEDIIKESPKNCFVIYFNHNTKISKSQTLSRLGNQLHGFIGFSSQSGDIKDYDKLMGIIKRAVKANNPIKGITICTHHARWEHIQNLIQEIEEDFPYEQIHIYGDEFDAYKQWQRYLPLYTQFSKVQKILLFSGTWANSWLPIDKPLHWVHLEKSYEPDLYTTYQETIANNNFINIDDKKLSDGRIS